MCSGPRPLMPATAMRMRSLAPRTLPEAFVPATVNAAARPPAAARSENRGGYGGHGSLLILGRDGSVGRAGIVANTRADNALFCPSRRKMSSCRPTACGFAA